MKGIVFAEEEFVTTVACLPTTHVHMKKTIEREQVFRWVEETLSSEGARQALIAEAKKRVMKTTAIFTRLAKHYKITRTPINLVSMSSVVAHAMQGSRVPKILEEEELGSLTAQCGEILTHFCHRFIDSMNIVMPQQKLHGFVVGLLYLMRTGVWMFDSVEVLPSIPLLRSVLPLESQLQPLLKLSTKIVTECENTIKSTFRMLGRKDLLDLGFPER